MTQKIIIDTDPGVDDAIAIQLAINSPELDVLGLTTVFGNVPVSISSKNALVLGDFANPPLEVYEGEGTPITQAPLPHPDFVHGEDGFGNVDWPASDRQLPSKNAIDFMIESIEANPGEVTIVALGPLTNLAELLRHYPQAAEKVKQVIVMGGAIFTTGNVSPVAEANIINDPHAAEMVFAANWEVVMVGLDVTTKVVMSRAFLDRVAQANPYQGPFLRKVSDFYIDFYMQEMGIDGCCVHDPSTIAYLIAPELFETAEGAIRVITDGLCNGQTTFAPSHRSFAKEGWADRPQHKTCTKVKSQELLDLLEQRLSRQP